MDQNPYKSPQTESRTTEPDRPVLERLAWGPLFSPRTLGQMLFGPRWAILVLLTILLAIVAGYAYSYLNYAGLL